MSLNLHAALVLLDIHQQGFWTEVPDLHVYHLW